MIKVVLPEGYQEHQDSKNDSFPKISRRPSFTLHIDIQVIPEISHTVTIKLVSANHKCISSSDKFSDYDTRIALTA